jgi:hypothetical protein
MSAAPAAETDVLANGAVDPESSTGRTRSGVAQVLWGIAFELAFAAAVIYLPPLQRIFDTAALGPHELLPLLAFPRAWTPEAPATRLPCEPAAP